MQKIQATVQYQYDFLRTCLWGQYSRLFFCSDRAGWVLDNEARELARIARSLGIKVADEQLIRTRQKQSVFFPAIYILLSSRAFEWGWNVGSSYFHGIPGRGNETFDKRFNSLCKYHERIQRLHVSNTQFREVVLESGIAPEKVHVIPIGINIRKFPQRTTESRHRFREKYRIPVSSVVIGSFQKDGNGWEEGLTPKMIKGPDIFLEVIDQLKDKIDDLFVILTGPARGYIKAGLTRLGVPFSHQYLSDYNDISELYQCLDLYIVPSREEGGPKGILEAMASGVPLVTTKVGQANDLILHGVNGWLAEVDDVDGLTSCSIDALGLAPQDIAFCQASRKTAEENSYDAQVPLWHRFFTGFVNTSK